MKWYLTCCFLYKSVCACTCMRSRPHLFNNRNQDNSLSHHRNQQSQLHKSVVSLLLYFYISREEILFFMFDFFPIVCLMLIIHWTPFRIIFTSVGTGSRCYAVLNCSAQSPNMAAYSFSFFYLFDGKKESYKTTKIIKYTQTYKTIMSGEIVGRGSVKSASRMKSTLRSCQADTRILLALCIRGITVNA